jgi:hypothetical protein
MNLANLDPKKREQYLMMICGVMLLIGVIPLGFYLFGANVTQMKKKIEVASEEIEKLEIKRLEGLKYERQITQNAADALPVDNALAASEYKNWLTTLVSRFEGAQVNNTGTTPVRARQVRGQASSQGPDTYYTNHKFNVSGKTTLNDLGRFLQQFYEVRTPHLIRSMTIKPDSTNARRGDTAVSRVDVTINIEAISIPQTTNKTFEAHLKDNRDETDWRRMIAAIADRNFFAPFVPVPPAPPEGGTPSSPAVVPAMKHTYLSGVTWSNDRGQAWFNFRLDGRWRILRVGDRFRVGEANCTIEAIHPDDSVDVRVEARSSGQLSRSIYRLRGSDTFFDAEFVRDLDEEGEEAAQQAATVNEPHTGSGV